MTDSRVAALARKWCPVHSVEPDVMGTPARCVCIRLTAAISEALEEADKIAFRFMCDCPETMLCGHRVAAGKIAAAIRALRRKG